MNGSYTGSVRLWEEWTTALVSPTALASSSHLGGHVLAGPHAHREFADRLYAWEALNPQAPSPRSGEGAEPYTLQWFLNIENQRHGRSGRWIPHLLEFARHSGETLLGLGTGLGTDWLQYARNGAEVIACTPSAEQLTLIRRNFELRGLHGRFVHASPEALPLDSASIDVACVSGVLHEVADPRRVVQELYRVLKPGGKVIAVTLARYDVEYWRSRCLSWRSWFGGAGKVARGTDEGRFTGRRLKRLFDRFVEHRVHKRQLRRSEVPHPLRWFPVPALERLFGHVLVLKSFKPLSSAIAQQAAA